MGKGLSPVLRFLRSGLKLRFGLPPAGVRTRPVPVGSSGSRWFTPLIYVRRYNPRCAESTLGRPPLLERLLRIRRDLQLRAMVICESARVVDAMLSHELHDLQGALPAADVRELHVRLKGSHLAGRSRGMHEQAIGKQRDLGWVLDDS